MGEIGRHEARMFWVMVQVALSDVECKLDPAAQVETFTHSVLEVSARRQRD